MDTYQAVYDAVCSRFPRVDVAGAISEAVRLTGLDSHALHVAETAREAIYTVQDAMLRPSVQYRPRIFVDGDQWCALYGENVQDGVAGFGSSPAAAMADFDTRWRAEIRAVRIQPAEVTS